MAMIRERGYDIVREYETNKHMHKYKYLTVIIPSDRREDVLNNIIMKGKTIT